MAPHADDDYLHAPHMYSIDQVGSTVCSSDGMRCAACCQELNSMMANGASPDVVHLMPPDVRCMSHAETTAPRPLPGVRLERTQQLHSHMCVHCADALSARQGGGRGAEYPGSGSRHPGLCCVVAPAPPYRCSRLHPGQCTGLFIQYWWLRYAISPAWSVALALTDRVGCDARRPNWQSTSALAEPDQCIARDAMLYARHGDHPAVFHAG